MKRVKQIFAWIAIIIIVGLVAATIVTSIQGSPLSIPMLGLTMGVSVALWVLLWFLDLIGGRKNSGQTGDSEKK